MSLVLDVAPKLTLEQDLAALNIAQDQLLAVGVVAAVDAWIDPGMAEVYIAAAKQGSLRMRFDLAFRFAPGEWQQNLEYFASVKRQVDDLAAPQLTANTVKFFADGAFGSGTAYVSEPYLEFAAGGTHGQAVWTQEEFEAAAQAALELGLKLHIHAIGDAAVSQSLTVIEKLGAPSGSVIAHTELVAPGDFERFARLGVIANFEPYWAQQNAMLTGCHARLGTQRIDRMYAMRDALAAGAAVSFGSDWPVSSYIPLEGIQVAVTRATFEAPESRWTPEQALTASEAVRAYTEAVAGQMSDSDAGTLFAGSRADFVVLASDPLVSPMEAIAKSKVLATFVGGQNFFGSI